MTPFFKQRYCHPKPFLRVIALMTFFYAETNSVYGLSEAERTQAQESNIPAELTQNEDPQWGRTPPIDGEATILHGLDKTTARVFAMEAKHGQQIKFGTLRITVRGCKKNPPEEQPEAAAFLEILEEKTGDMPVTLFSGWMFASSPAISGLEHPVYDVWVTDCLTSKTPISHTEKDQGR